MNLAGRRIGVYARYSSDAQNARSAADQTELVRRFVETHGGRLDPALAFLDEAVSGAVRDRPGLLALRAAVRAGRLDVLVIEDLSRLGRDVGDVSEIRRELAFYRVRLLGVSDGTDTDQRGAELGLDVRSVLAAHERREIGYRTLRGMTARARDGLATGAVPYGYRTVPIDGSRDAARRIEVDAEAAAVIRRIFAAHADGHSPKRIAAALNTEGIRSPRGRGWRSGAVREMLLNPRYVGRWIFGARTWERHPTTRKRLSRPSDTAAVVLERPELAIVDADTWGRVARRFVAYRRPDARPAPRRYMLSGIVRCAACGEPMTVQGGNARHRYFGCRRAAVGLPCETGRRCVHEGDLREAVLGLVRDRLFAPHALAELHAIARDELAAERSRIEAERGDRDATLSRKREQARRLVTAVAEGFASPTVLGALRDIEHEIARLEAHAPGAPPALPTADEIVQRALDVSAAFDRDVDEGREVLRRFLDGGAVHVGRHGAGWTVRAGLLPLALIAPKNKAAHEGRPSFDTSGCGGAS